MISSIALARAELLADVTVAAALAGAGDDQITHSRQAREGVAVPAHRLAELGHLAHRSSDHHGAGVLADAERIAHADRDRIDVLQRAGHLDADHIVGGVRTKALGAEQLCERGREMLVRHRQHRGGGVPVGDLACDVRPRENAGGMSGQHLVDDLAHPHVGALLEPLDQRHHRHPRPQLLGQLAPARCGTRATGRPSRSTSAVLAASEKSVVARSVRLSSTSSPRYLELR